MAGQDPYRDYYEAVRPFKAEYDAEIARIESAVYPAKRAAWRRFFDACKPARDKLHAYLDYQQVTGKENDVG
jgi:hypothetical protein